MFSGDKLLGGQVDRFSDLVNGTVALTPNHTPSSSINGLEEGKTQPRKQDGIPVHWAMSMFACRFQMGILEQHIGMDMIDNNLAYLVSLEAFNVSCFLCGCFFFRSAAFFVQ